jgi:hypothetical protein
MPTRKAPPTQQLAKLDDFYSVGEAAVRMNLKTQAEHEAGSTKGERWLRDGVNHKGFPAHRLNRQLMFSDSDLAEIAAMNRSAPTQSVRRQTRRRAMARPAEARIPRQQARAAA